MLFTGKSLGCESKARRASSRTTHTQCSWWFSVCVFTQTLCTTVLLNSMGRGVDWSLADVQFVRDGMAGGANLSLLARSRGWSYSSLEKLVRRIKHASLRLSSHTHCNIHTTQTHTHNKAQLHHAGLFANWVASFMTPSAPFEKSK